MPFTVPRTAGDARVIADISAGGRVFAFFRSTAGLLWLIFGGLLFLGLPLLDRIRKARRRDAETAADVRGELAILAAQLRRVQTEQECGCQTATQMLAQLDRVTDWSSGRSPAARCAEADSRLGSSAALVALRSVRDSMSPRTARRQPWLRPARLRIREPRPLSVTTRQSPRTAGSSTATTGQTGGREPGMPTDEPGTAAPTRRPLPGLRPPGT